MHLAFSSLSFAVNTDEITKKFIQLVIETQGQDGGFFSLELIRAIPRGEQIRARLGACPEAFLIPDIVLWEPLAYFTHLSLFCPSCAEIGVQESLRPIRWKDGSTTNDQPRLLYGLRNDVLLVGRVYLCKNKHQILSHDNGILSQIDDQFPPPFVLFHKTGVTRELFQFFTSHITAGMTIADVLVLWHQTLFDDYGLRKLYFSKEVQGKPERFPDFVAHSSKVGEKTATACYIHNYFKKEHLYARRMRQMTANSLSADHTFKVSANIGFWFRGKWVQLYDSLFIVKNEIGIVLTWQLCKGASFQEVEDLLRRLQERLKNLRCPVNHFYIDNCCQWRAKLTSIFDNSLVLLDPFHAIQRFTSKIPKKGIKGCPLRKLRYQMISDFKLVLRNPTDCGKKRTKETPSKDVIERNIADFLKQWKPVAYEGAMVIPQPALDEIDKLLVHVRKGCLSEIVPSGGTSRNEGIHRVLNKTLKKSRIGIQFALALLGVFFYKWNEKQLTVRKKQRSIRVTPPIESHFSPVEIGSKDAKETFGENDNYILSRMDGTGPSTSSLDVGNQEGLAADIVSNLNDCINDDGLSSSSDEDEHCNSDFENDKTTARLTESQKSDIMNTSKSMEKLFAHIGSVGSFEKFKPKMAMFAKSSLTLLNNDLPSEREPEALDNILANYNMVRVNIPPNGNCFFLSIAHALVNYIVPNKSVSNSISSHLAAIGLINEFINDVHTVSSQLRELLVQEWLNNSEQYKPFLHDSQSAFEREASLFLNDGHFAAQLGNSMSLAMANVLQLPIVVITQMENFPVIPITPRESLQCLPIFIAFDHTGAGHYDAVMQNPAPKLPTSTPQEASDPQQVCSDGCRCGQGAKKRETVITSCDQFKKRCKCFQGVVGCTKKCQCLGCENPYGKNTGARQRASTIATGTRKRRSSGITTQLKSGSEFFMKKPCPSNVSSWSFLEEIILAQLIHGLLPNSDIDVVVIHMQYMEFVDNKDIFPKSLKQVTGKVVAYLNDNEQFKTLLKEQVRLSWFM